MTNKTSKSDPYIGHLLNSRYLIRDILGQGGMGKVYLAEDVTKECMLVAVKILTLNLNNPQIAERFGREIFIGAQLGKKSKNIIRLLSYGVTESKVPFYVMEYLRGRPLNRILKKNYLTLPIFIEVCQQICLGLDCAHKGVNLKGKIYPIIHRDIKPENIFITEHGNKSEMVKILDFGIAKFLTETTGMTLTESFVGSLPYSSPEHMEGKKHIDARSDIYSLGLLMFEMLTGKHPFHNTSQSFGTWYQLHHFQNPPSFAEVNPDVQVPWELEKLVLRCLAKDVKKRPQTVREILDILQQVKNKIENKSKNNHSQNNDDKIDGNLPPSVNLIPVTSITEKECEQKKWPSNKPISLIGFPQLLHIQDTMIPTFWAMLPEKEIAELISQKYQIEFISQINIYPMVLWITLLYNQEISLSRWLSYYIDINDEYGYKIIHALEKIGYYHLLLFALEKPHDAPQVITLTMTPQQRQQLDDYINNNQNNQNNSENAGEKVNGNISSQQAKSLLKNEYEKFKAERTKILFNQVDQSKSGILSMIKLWIAKLFKIF